MARMATARKLLLGLLGGGGGIAYLFRDEFTTDETAPIATPHTALPGPGTLTVVQTDGQYSTSNGRLVVPAQSTPVATDLGTYSTTDIPRAAGVALFGLHRFSTVATFYFQLGTGAVNNEGSTHQFTRSPYGYELQDGSQLHRVGGDPATGTDYIFGIILRSTGAYYLADEAILAVGYDATAANVRVRSQNTTAVYTLDYLRAVQLPAPFSDDNVAIYTDATPTDGDTATAGQDALHYIQWTPALNEVFEIRFRYIDDDNCMVLRCSQAGSTMKLIKRIAAAETEIASTAGFTFTVGTKRRVYLRYTGPVIYSGVVNVGIGAQTTNCGHNSDVTGCKISGGATLANWHIYPSILPSATMDMISRYTNPFSSGSGRSPQTISVANGGDIAAAIATMNSGDTLSLAAGGSYTFAGGVNGFTGLPSGYWGQRTTVEGNGATITGGAISLSLTGKRHFNIRNLNLIDATSRCVAATNCRWFSFENVVAASDVGVALLDVFRFVASRNGVVTNCTAGTSTGWGEHDGFECTDHCGDMTFSGCEAYGVIHGFEVWTGDAPNGRTYRITWRNCSSHNNAVGYSSEGGTQSVAHVEIVADGCTAATNSEFDYQGIDGATLYIEHGTGGTTNGSVTIRS
jgi:hypothetical protein